MSKVKQLPPRNKVKKSDCWDLSTLFVDDDAWEAAFKKWEKRISQYAGFQGRLGNDAKTLADCFKFDLEFDRESERLGTYAFLKVAEDTSNSTYQRMQGRYVNVASKASQAGAYIRPEILAIPKAKITKFLADHNMKPYRLIVERLLRQKPHTLGKNEEKLLAMQTEMSQAAGQIFGQLNNADLKFGTVKDETGQLLELSHATFSKMMHCPKRNVRKAAFDKYYQEFDDHKNTLAATLNGSIQCDIYYAKARNHAGSLQAALFPDRVPVGVYDNLIKTVRDGLPALYRYYDVRRRKMRLRDIHHYDTYVPILSDLQVSRTWNQAVELVMKALQPLGDGYCGILKEGLQGRWCDRYENRGKRSGAFSCGSYDADPFILMNYQNDVLDHVFTLAHEAGHSMHSFFSAKTQPYAYYDYVIFVAEVASTFNEQLLHHYMIKNASDDRERAFLVNRQIDAIRGTIYRQTMFAEFEKITHKMAEEGEPLTVDSFRRIYRELLDAYFGPDFVIDDVLSLECFRIPHFYRAFYVFKYATGMSAALALSDRVLNGGPAELAAYQKFLGGGCSKDPLDLLRDAGVDMEQPTAIQTAMRQFAQLVEELDKLV